MARGTTYWQPNSAAIERVTLPYKIKCEWCDKVKNPGAFSKNAQLVLKQKIYKDGNVATDAAKIGQIKCTTCSGGPATEKECDDCGKIKSIDKFSKVQRKRDDGICEACSLARNQTPAHAYDSDSGSGGGSGSENSDTSDDGASEMGTLSLGGSTTTGGVALSSQNNGSQWGSSRSHGTTTSSTDGGVPTTRWSPNRSTTASTPSSSASTKVGTPSSTWEKIPSSGFKPTSKTQKGDTYDINDLEVEKDDSSDSD